MTMSNKRKLEKLLIFC